MQLACFTPPCEPVRGQKTKIHHSASINRNPLFLTLTIDLPIKIR